MRNFTCVQDLGNLKQALAEAFEIKKDRYQFTGLGKNKTLLMIFFNSSLRTRLSTQKAAMNLGMNTMVLDVNQGAWKLETERGVIMDGDKPEHLLEAIPVMGCYCDVIGIRSFARFESKEDDYNEKILNQFIQYSGRPVFSMEAATRHPLQSFADLITIEEYKKTARPKVVMTWAPHPKALPQAVPNSFAEWMNATDYEFVITHPEGYELDPRFVGNARVEYDQKKAFEGADFIYAKNWAAYADPNYGKVLNTDRSWTVDTEKMALTNNAYFMHCLPVRRNMIVTDDVIESPQSIVIPEAANREISAQTVLKKILTSLLPGINPPAKESPGKYHRLYVSVTHVTCASRLRTWVICKSFVSTIVVSSRPLKMLLMLRLARSLRCMKYWEIPALTLERCLIFPCGVNWSEM